MLEKKITFPYTIENANPLQRQIILASIRQIIWVMNYSGLRKFILNFTNQYHKPSFLQTKKTNEWHLQRFIQADSRYGSTFVFPKEIALSIAVNGKKVVFKMENGTVTVDLNTQYSYRQIPSIVNSFVHEYCHIVGMKHKFRNKRWEQQLQTAPFAISSKAEQMVSERMCVTSPVTPTANKPSFTKRISRFFRSRF